MLADRDRDLHQPLRRARLAPRRRAAARRLGRHQGDHRTRAATGSSTRSRNPGCAGAAAPVSRPGSNGRSCRKTSDRPTLSRGQRRRERARHLQGPRHPALGPAQADRGLRAGRRRHGGRSRLHLHPRRVLQRGAAPADRDRRGLRRGADRQERLRLGLRHRRVSASRRRRLYLRRGDRAARKPRRQEGPAAPETPFPGRGRPLWLPDHGQQRRDDRRRAGDPEARRRLVCRDRPAAQHRHQNLLHLRPREPALQCRGGDEHPDAGADRAARRRRARRLGQSAGGDPRRLVDPVPAGAGLRQGADGFRRAGRREDRASAPRR